MLIARQKRKENIVEYLLYMWQLEDILRACNFDIKQIETLIISKYDVDADTILEIRDWYLELIQEMKEQGLTQKGHLQEVHEVMSELLFLHNTLFQIKKDKTYIKLFEAAEPNIELLRRKNVNLTFNLIENCLNGVYGLLVLRLKKKQVSKETEEAIGTISKMLGYLAAKYKELTTSQQ